MKGIDIAFFADEDRVLSDLAYLKGMHGTSKWNSMNPRDRGILIHHIQVLTELAGILAEESADNGAR